MLVQIWDHFSIVVTKVSVIMWSQNWTRNIRSGVLGKAKNLKIPVLHAFFKYLWMPTTPLLRGLGQFWDHFITNTFVILLLKKRSQIYNMTIKKFLFKDILFLGAFLIVILIVNSISNLDHEGVKLSCWNFVWLISAPKDTIKNSKPTGLDVFDKNWHSLIWHVKSWMWHMIYDTHGLLNIV